MKPTRRVKRIQFGVTPRLMGLIPLFIDSETTVEEKQNISEYLVLFANEMDKVIKDITDATCAAAVK